MAEPLTITEAREVALSSESDLIQRLCATVEALYQVSSYMEGVSELSQKTIAGQRRLIEDLMAARAAVDLRNLPYEEKWSAALAETERSADAFVVVAAVGGKETPTHVWAAIPERYFRVDDCPRQEG